MPQGSGQAYSECTGWNRFRIIEEDFSGVEEVESTAEDSAYYDLTGRRVVNPEPGQVVIHREGNVSSKVITR